MLSGRLPSRANTGFRRKSFKIKSPLLISNVQTDPRAADPDSLRAARHHHLLGFADGRQRGSIGCSVIFFDGKLST
jgi:hypothetical protein